MRGPAPNYKQPLYHVYGCQPDEPQASLATTNRCNHVYLVLLFVLSFMYAVLHYLYSVGNKITTTTTTTTTMCMFLLKKGPLWDMGLVHCLHSRSVGRSLQYMWWILHCWLIEYSLRDSSWDLHGRISVRSGILLSDLNDQTFYTISHLNHPRIDAVI